MRILVLHNFYQYKGGEDSVVDAESRLLQKYGNVVFFYSKHNDEIKKFGIIRKLLFPLAIFFNLKTIFDLRKIVKNFRPDVAHLHNVFPLISPSAYIYLKLKGIPVVQTVHNFRFICANALFFIENHICERCFRLNIYPALKRCYKKSILLSLIYSQTIFFYRFSGFFSLCISRFICLSEFSKMKMAEAGYPTEKISIKGNFISKAKDGAIAEKSENYCLYLGRLSDEKGIKTLLSAFKKIEGCTLKIAGAGPLEDLVRLSISENVEYLGFVGKVEKEKLLNNAMFLILPSECYEAFPVVIIEAYMARIPVITSRLGSLPEIVKDGETGFLFRPGDVTDLRAKIRYFIGNSGECKRMGMNAYEFAEERFSEENNYEQLMAIYNGVVR